MSLLSQGDSFECLNCLGLRTPYATDRTRWIIWGMEKDDHRQNGRVCQLFVSETRYSHYVSAAGQRSKVRAHQEIQRSSITLVNCSSRVRTPIIIFARDSR